MTVTYPEDAEQTNKTVRIFISYAPEDEAFLIALERHLSAMKKTANVVTWSALSLAPGEDIGTRLQRKLSLADVVLILISSDYIATDGCWEHQFQQLAHGAASSAPLLIPIRIRPVDTTGTLISHLACLPANGVPVSQWDDQDAAWASVTDQFRRMLDRPAHISALNTVAALARKRQPQLVAVAAVSLVSIASIPALLWRSKETVSEATTVGSGDSSTRAPSTAESSDESPVGSPSKAQPVLSQSAESISTTPLTSHVRSPNTPAISVNPLPPAQPCDIGDTIRSCRDRCRQTRIEALKLCADNQCRIQAADVEENLCIPNCNAKGCR